MLGLVSAEGGTSGVGRVILPPESQYLAPRLRQSYPDNIWDAKRALELARRCGLRHVITRLVAHPSLPWIKYGWAPASALARRLSNRRLFLVKGVSLRYEGWPSTAERRVELPLARWYLEAHAPRGGRVLEVGNVLGRTCQVPRDVVDKYDISPGVIAADVVDYAPAKKYDNIVAISTLEHVGYDEHDNEPGKFSRAFRNLYDNCLADEGSFLVTVPLGYHLAVDRVILGNHFGIGEVYILAYEELIGTWKQVDYSDLSMKPLQVYSYSHHHAWNLAVWIGTKVYDSSSPGSHDA